LGVVLAAACASVALAQQPPAGTPPIDQLQQVLQLTDQQVQDLVRLRQERMDAVQQLIQVQGTQEKRRQLRALLGQDPLPAPIDVGALVLAIQIDEQHIRQVNARYTEALRNVLTSEQTQQLRRLNQALRLQPAARQAVAWDLIPAPRAPRPADQP